MFTQITQITDKFMVKRRSNVLWAVIILSASRMFLLDLLFALLQRYNCYSNMMTSRPSVLFDLPFSHHSQNKALKTPF